MSLTLSITAQLKTHLAALERPGGNAGEKLFELVEVAMNKNLREVLRKLYSVKNRVALIVPVGDQFQVLNRNVHSVQSTRALQVHILVADRDWVSGNQAAFGGDDNPGVIIMKDAVVESFQGAISLDHIPIIEATEQFEVAESKDTNGRQFWVIEISFPVDASKSLQVRSRF